MRLIIVDDDLPTVEAVRDSINWAILGIDEVEIAFNVEGAKRLFEKGVPELVICDIEMPKGSGIDLLRWIRENDYKSEFIFLTCHESFEYAAIALKLRVIAYITKPFNVTETEMEVSKAVEKIRKEDYFKEYSEYGEYWLSNKAIMMEDFWRELLFSKIAEDNKLLEEEIRRRKLTLNLEEYYQIVLVSVVKSENQGMFINDQTFEYAIKKLSAEVILGEMDLDYVIHYVNDRNHYVAVILRDSFSLEEIKKRCTEFIFNCNKYLECRASCYISEKVTMNLLPENRARLEEMDRNNIIFREKVFFEGDQISFKAEGQNSINVQVLSDLLQKGEKLLVVNYMKDEMELLAERKNLDASVMFSIHQDFMQIIYSFLYKNGVQAHKLFVEKVYQNLDSCARNSVFDMLKWVHYITARTIDYLEEVKKSYTIIDKAKEYIHEHYKEDITRKDVAASVFLTPDYLAKMFKMETGIALKDYINYYRIDKAKALLRNEDVSVSMVASEVGFDNFSYFSTIFKKLTGTSPVLFRKEDGK